MPIILATERETSEGSRFEASPSKKFMIPVTPTMLEM
jgi:hypothetical protein